MSVSPDEFRWSLLIYRVSGPARQQRILRAFHRIASPGMTVLGTQSGPDWFVIVDCDSMVHELRARRLIVGMDRAATRVLRTKVPA
jgi:hypothetical protein